MTNDTITLTRSEVQQVLDAFDVATTHFAKDRNEILAAVETLRARLAQPEPGIVQDAIVYGTGITKDGKRIDPASIYKEPEPEPVVDSTAWILRTNEDYAAWCKTYYQPDTLDELGMASLHGLWAWQEQERRKAAPPQREQVSNPCRLEPVAWVEKDGELVWQNYEAAIGRNLYLAPPQREPSSIPCQLPEPEAVTWRYKVRNPGGELVWTMDPGNRTVLEFQPLYTSIPHRMEPVGYFTYYDEDELWEQCIDGVAGQEGVYPLYR